MLGFLHSQQPPAAALSAHGGRASRPASPTRRSETLSATVRLVVAADAATRLDAADGWLAAQRPDAAVLVVAPTWEACDDRVRAAALRSGARFGTVRLTLDRLAARLATPALARASRAPASGLSLVAVAARVVHQLASKNRLRYFAGVALRPGFPAAVARTLGELRMNGVSPDAVARLPRGGPDLAALAKAVEKELAAANLADRAAVFAAATEAAASAPDASLVGLPLLLLDLPATSRRELELLAALVERARAVLATAPTGDGETIARLEQTLGCNREPLAPSAEGSLATLQAHLFEDATPAEGSVDTSVTLLAWPGEARECVEIARRIQAEAAEGIPFDRMAVLLRAPEEYRAHLEEAFRRAEIPAFFARGTTRPHPAGRALLALLACAAEGLSARRFAEYVSLGQVPDPGSAGDASERWVPPDDDLLPTMPAPPSARVSDAPLADPDETPVVDGTLRAPWRWEQLLVDAAVIGKQERWARRLAGLEAELRTRRAALADDEDEARIAWLDRQLRDLDHLRACALPLIKQLAALPERATWGVWLAALRDLAVTALREPDAVLATLGELEPMAPVADVDLDEVQLVLAPRLRELTVPPPRRRYGAVFVAAAEAARGLVFDVVFVPGLAEKMFPRKIVEDPILRDVERGKLKGAGLATQATRVAAERLALRLAAGAARRRLHLSYPRLDVEQARPRVPSFYGLEALRAAEGRLPGFHELGARAEPATGSARLGWPAPRQPADAIDEAEYDLALLAPLLDADPATTTGTATYLLGANPHLARALRARARRWLKRWTSADGLVEPDALATAALAKHQLTARSFSPTALQHFAVCPYRFFLQAIHRLQPRQEAVAVEVLDPLTRGALFHEVQFELLTALREAKLLPLTAATLPAARDRVDQTLDDLAARYADKLAPAIERVWADGINTVRADLREWLRRTAEAGEGWTPYRFELSFGLPPGERGGADPASVRDPVPVTGALRLRGSIDLVEQHVSGSLRATDHKTGKARAKAGVVVGGGAVLQPVLYALVCEQLLEGRVVAGRLYYCTADGGYEERVVGLDADSRASAATVEEVVGRALETGFLPAAPTQGACDWCDYRPVCGPYEWIRTSKNKPTDRLADLVRLRGLP